MVNHQLEGKGMINSRSSRHKIHKTQEAGTQGHSRKQKKHSPKADGGIETVLFISHTPNRHLRKCSKEQRTGFIKKEWQSEGCRDTRQQAEPISI